MKKFTYNLIIVAALIGGAFFASSCSSDNHDNPNNPDNAGDIDSDPVKDGREYLTVAGVAMGEQPGDGRGGMFIYPISLKDITNPDYKVDIFNEGYQVNTGSSTRLQATEDGRTLISLTYAGDNGGQLYKYDVIPETPELFKQTEYFSVVQYLGKTPRWVKLYDGDQTAVAVNTMDVKNNNELPGHEDEPFKYARGYQKALAFDIPSGTIRDYSEDLVVKLTEEEEAQGHYIQKIGAPTLNKTKDKLLIGAWMAKKDPATGENDRSDYERLGAKIIILDYPALSNPRLITSKVGFGDMAGYRSFNSFLVEDGDIYAAIQWDAHGKSHFMKIDGNTLEFDDSYSFELDPILGENTQIYGWHYHKDGIAYIAYGIEGDDSKQSFARVDLFNKTATRIEGIPMGSYVGRMYQNMAVIGDNAYISAGQLGKDGNVFIINIDGTVTKGATLLNHPGNSFINAL